MMSTRLRFFCTLIVIAIPNVDSFSVEKSGPVTLFDRFRAVCPATRNDIQRYDPNLSMHDGDLWVAIYRSSNNKPSVWIRDEFFDAMRLATGVVAVQTTLLENGDGDEVLQTVPRALTPVAIARLRPSDVYESTWVMDCMRCLLPKESMDDSCDGGSEHCEALSAAIDTLLCRHLSRAQTMSVHFHGSIRTKATLITGRLLEQRGFVPVEVIQKDMASHVSSLDTCLERYATRSISIDAAKSPSARQRALQIVSLLGSLDRAQEIKVDRERQHDREQEPPYDPWAGGGIH